MAGYSPLKIYGNTSGLIKNREEFILPDDAYPQLVNAYVWRERLLRKKGYELLGRLQRNIGTTDGAGNAVINILPLPIQTGIASFTVGDNLFNDPGTTANPGVQTLNTSGPGTATLNRLTGVLTITGSNANTDIYYIPGLPVMGIRTRQINNSVYDKTLFFDQNYCYTFDSVNNQFEEFLPATAKTWNASGETVYGTSFFWSTNYWVSANPPFTTANKNLFWVTNNTGVQGASMDPIRITDGTTWVDFNSGTWNQIDATTYLVNALSFLPFRGRLLMFNTWEGPFNSGGSALNYPNRIRWSTIGNPFIAYHDTTGPNDPSTGSWRDDIRGQGGFLDIPTAEDIISVGFVRDNLVIYCETTTWQLRYTGRSIAPFQIERVNSELGGEGPFSAIQFDTSLVSIGDKGIIKCDSYEASRIDIKIPDYVFSINNQNNGPARVQGQRDFINRLAYWTIPVSADYDINNGTKAFPNQRLVYNYENESWAIFTDSLTALGTYLPESGRTWLNTQIDWDNCNFTWIGSQRLLIPDNIGGNQQGFVEYLDTTNSNDVSLYISNISDSSGRLLITSPNHNLLTGTIIQIVSIPAGSDYDSLNNTVYYARVVDENSFVLFTYNTTSLEFSTPVEYFSGTYVGGGLIKVRDNFSIVSKKFNFIDEGQSIQMGYLDILMNSTGGSEPGAISLNVYLDYNENETSNTLPNNDQDYYSVVGDPDTFFNATIPTTESTLNGRGGTKFWQRVFCPTRANFLTLQYTFSNAQMNGIEQLLDVQIDAQVLWLRKSGRMCQI